MFVSEFGMIHMTPPVTDMEGGNVTIKRAAEMGAYAKAAGMNILLDLHLSDFWTDPGKQQAPKAWADMKIDAKATAVSEYVTSCLTTMKNSNADVSMIQIGNETNNGVCGETEAANMNKILDAGCDAVTAFNTKYETDIKSVIHITNPQNDNVLLSYAKQLAAYDGDGDGTNEGVSYDVFATSYYPNSHGTMENLTKVLTDVAQYTGKNVMVAETSWAYTDLNGDGFGDDTYDKGDYVDYNVTVQGQADVIRDVADAVNDVEFEDGTKAGLGFFYWEPAWIPIISVYDEDGNLKDDAEALITQNKTYWEKFGSGWASSYSAEYDPDDAGMWYGGSSMDNQSVFDFYGYPLASLNAFNGNYLKYGATSTKAYDDYRVSEYDLEVGKELSAETLDENNKVTVKYTDGTSEEVTASWDADDITAVNAKAKSTSGIGSYVVNGTVTVEGDETEHKVKCTVNVVPENLLADYDYGFEESTTKWTVNASTYTDSDGDSKASATANKTDEDQRTGSRCLHFYSSTDFNFTVSQAVEVTKAGYYNLSIYMQGLASAGTRDGESLTLSATTSAGTASDTTETTTSTETETTSAGNTVDTAVTATETDATTSEITVETITSETTEEATTSDTTTYTSQSVTLGGWKNWQKVNVYGIYVSNDMIKNGKSNSATITISINAALNEGAWGTMDDVCLYLRDDEDQPKSLSDEGITVTVQDAENIIYTGKELEPSIIVKDGDTELVADKDYAVTYTDNVDVGTGTAVIKGDSAGTLNYRGETSATFTIKAATISENDVALEYDTYELEGTEDETATPGVTVTVNSNTLKKGTDYTVEYEDNDKAGTAKVVITGKGNYTGEVTKEFEITETTTQEPTTATTEVDTTATTTETLTTATTTEKTTTATTTEKATTASTTEKATTASTTEKATTETTTEKATTASTTEKATTASTTEKTTTASTTEKATTETTTEKATTGATTETQGATTTEIPTSGETTETSGATTTETPTSGETTETQGATTTETPTSGETTETQGATTTETPTSGTTTEIPTQPTTGTLGTEESTPTTGTSTPTTQPGSTATPAEIGATLQVPEGVQGTFTVTNAGATPEVSYTPEKNATSVIIPATITDVNGVVYKVTSVAANSFKGNTKLETVVIGENVFTIEENAFSGCKKLKKVTIGNNVMSIGKAAFKGCTSLTTVKIPASVKVVGASAFSGDTKLKTVTMGSGVTTVGDKAFYNCKKLTKITLPKNVTKIGKQAFAKCKSLKTLTIKSAKLTKSRVGSKAFKGINAKATIKVPKNKLKVYKSFLKSKGIGSKVKIKKS
jgi:arabinogalactan endo-1,4-beta-galactosidase